MIKKKIGIDLDNTIINYNNAFTKFLKKKKIHLKEINRDKIKKISNENPKIINWTYAQEEIYGKYIKYAKLFSYYKSFEKFAIKNKFKLYIISHKTRLSEYSKKYDLRKVANLWLKKNLKKKKYKIFFLNSITEKLNKIKTINPDFYIDDLEKILINKRLPKKIKKIHFSIKKKSKVLNFDNWKKIKEFIKKNENI